MKISSFFLFQSTVTKKIYEVTNKTGEPLSCSSSNIIYLLTCKRCKMQYVGETLQTLKKRMNGHRSGIKSKVDNILYNHFQGPCNCDDIIVQPIEDFTGDGRNEETIKQRKFRENYWMKELRTTYPYGLNDKCNGRIWKNKNKEDITASIFNPTKCIIRKNRTRNHNRTWSKQFLLEVFLAQVLEKYKTHDSWIFFCRKILCSLSKKTLKSISIILEEKIWVDPDENFPQLIFEVVQDIIKDRLHRFSLEKKSDKPQNFNRKVFTKIYFHNKGIELIQVARLFRRLKDKIPGDFKFREPPTVIYTRSPTIGQKIFNYKQTIQSIHTGEWKSDLFSCKCKDSKFMDGHHKHIVTGDLRIVENKKLRNLLIKGPTYREPVDINWNRVLKEIKIGILECQTKWTQLENKDFKTLDEWSNTILNAVNKRIDKLKKVRKFQPRNCKRILDHEDVKSYLINFQKDFVLVPTDKACNNISIVCKAFYIQMLLKEVGFFDVEKKAGRTYHEVKNSALEIIENHKLENKNFGVIMDEKQNQLPILLWIPKMHKNPSKQRFIAASHSCTTKNISSLIGKCLKLIQKAHQVYCEKIKNYSGYNLFWIVDNSLGVHKILQQYDTKSKRCRNL